MPYINVKITREGNTTREQKAAIVQGVTNVLFEVLGKPPESTYVVIDEVDLDNWGAGGLLTREFREKMARDKAGDKAGDKARGKAGGK